MDVANIEQADARLVAEAGKRITSFTLTPKKAGSTHLIITTESNGAEAKKYLPVTVSSSLALSTGDVTDTEPTGGSNAAKSFTVDFTTLSASDFGLSGFNSTNKDAPVQGKVKEVTLYPVGNTKLQIKSGNGMCTGINYNGESVGTLGKTIAIADSSRHIIVPVGGAGTLTVTYKTTAAADVTDKGQIGAYDADGTLIGEVASVAGVKGDNPLTVEVSEATDVYILYARNGTVKADGSTGTGGIDVTKIAFEAQ